MATILHPASLNALQQYRQACSVLRNTSRASNSAWYADALELDFQLFIRPDGPTVSSHYFNRKSSQWTPGPSFTEEILHDEEQFRPFIDEIINTARTQGAHSIGVILLIADEFATTELKPEFDNPAALSDIRNTAVQSPADILEDTSISMEHASWRVLPYPAAGSETIATTITLTRQFDRFLSALRQAGETANFPIITHALSAPLVALMGLPAMLQSSPGKSFVTILQYPWFTVMAFFNEHADLRLIRTLQHRGIRRATNFRNALSTTNASLEFLDPDLFIVPLGLDVDHTLETNLRANFGNCRIESLTTPEVEGLPSYCQEMAFASGAIPVTSGLTSHTFTVLQDEGWALQDFLPTPLEISQIYPNKSEMRILRLTKLARLAIAAITLGGLSFFAMGILQTMQRDEWKFDPDQANRTKARLSKLTAERQSIEHWNNLLQDRSKLWVVMESLVRMFPEKSGVLIKGCSYTVKPDNAAGQIRVGFVKSWKISGFARDEALEYLNSLNTRDGINAHFAEVAKVTGNSAYNPSIGNRNISVNVRTQENSGFKPIISEEMLVTDESTYPFSFDLTITQRFEATDPMAINVSKAP